MAHHAMRETPLEYAEVAALFSLCEETGVLTRKTSPSPNVLIGSIVGCPDTSDHLRVTIHYRSYSVSNIVWLLTYGTWPTKQVDHINRNKTDNRPQNLREATDVENALNRKVRSTNWSGMPGVSWYKKLAKWMVSITVHGVRIHLGYFIELEDAIKARHDAEVRYFGTPL